MSPILNHLVSSLSRHLAQITRFSLCPATSTSTVYRCLSTLTSVPTRLLQRPATVASVQAPSPSSCVQRPASLLGQCQHLVWLQPVSGMKTKTALKRRCKDCFIVRRRGRLFVFCKTHPRHKQRQGWGCQAAWYGCHQDYLFVDLNTLHWHNKVLYWLTVVTLQIMLFIWPLTSTYPLTAKSVNKLENLVCLEPGIMFSFHKPTMQPTSGSRYITMFKILLPCSNMGTHSYP